MYAFYQSGFALLYLATAVGGAIIARRYGGSWKTSFRGALFGFAGSVVGGFAVGFAVGFVRGLILTVFRTAHVQNAPAFVTINPFTIIVLSVAFAGAAEEIARIIGVSRGINKFAYRLGDVLMFGAGFAGGEIIFRAVGIMFRTIKSANPEVTFSIGWVMVISFVLAVLIYGFHVCMTILCFWVLSDERLRSKRNFLFPAMVACHGGANLAAGLLTPFDPMLLYRMVLWAAVTSCVIALVIVGATARGNCGSWRLSPHPPSASVGHPLPQAREGTSYHASRPRFGRAMPAPASANSRFSRCSASCLSNIAFAAALRFALNSSRLSPHHW